MAFWMIMSFADMETPASSLYDSRSASVKDVVSTVSVWRFMKPDSSASSVAHPG